MESIMNKIRKLDAYPKISEDFYSRTLFGGFITIASSIIMLLLFVSELRLYVHTVTETKLVVDTSRGEQLRINFDVTFPALPCSVLSLDAMDISGEQHLDVKHDIVKKRIDYQGKVIESRPGIGSSEIERALQKHGGRLEQNETYCGSCYGAESLDEDCCNSCQDVREAYRRKGWALSHPDLIDQCKREGFFQRIKAEEGEGCNIHGFLEVNKVAGNFHFAPGKSFQLSYFNMHNPLASFQWDTFNISHRINRLAFGDDFPGVVNPLDGVQWNQETLSGMYQYFIKVVPTVYKDMSGKAIKSNQFSVTEHLRGIDGGSLQSLHGVFFFYDLSPIKVTFTEEQISFSHFLTSVCAIVGGTSQERYLNFNRSFHCFGDIRFHYISWSKGNQEEDGTWKIYVIIGWVGEDQTWRMTFAVVGKWYAAAFDLNFPSDPFNQSLA